MCSSRRHINGKLSHAWKKNVNVFVCNAMKVDTSLKYGFKN